MVSENSFNDFWRVALSTPAMRNGYQMPPLIGLITVVFKLRKAFEKRERLLTGTVPVNNKTSSLAGQSVGQSISFKTGKFESV